MKTQHHRGFALPTIVIASIIMLTVLIVSVSASTSIRSALDAQYYDRLAKEAAEAGLARANDCLEQNNYIPSWGTKPLYPNTDCSGGDACTNAPSCFVTEHGNMRTSFEVDKPTTGSAQSVTMTAIGRVELIRASNGIPWKSYTLSLSSSSSYKDPPQLAGGAGYQNTGHIGYVVSSFGNLYGMGANDSQQIGTTGLGPFVSTPTQVALPAGVTKVLHIYTSGQGASFVCIIGDDGQMYCRGAPGDSSPNSMLYGTTGWQKFGLAAGLTAVSASITGYGYDAACVLASDNQVYCAGSNLYGDAGANSTLTTIPFNAPQKFLLSNINATLTAKKVVNGGDITCVIASDNNVYCAGENDYGQLGRGYATVLSNDPATRVPALYAMPGGRAVQDVTISYSTSTSVHVLATDGTIWDSGNNVNNDMAGTVAGGSSSTPTQYSDPTWGNGGAIVALNGNRCLDGNTGGGAGGNGVQVELWDCVRGASTQQWRINTNNNTIVFASTGRCLDRTNGGTADGTAIQLWDCLNNPNQQWKVVGNTIVDPNSGKCLDRVANGTVNTTLIQLWTCNGGTSQTWDGIYGATPLQNASGRCVDVDSSTGFANGSFVQLWDCNSGPSQQWVIRGDGSIYFPAANRCLDADYGGGGAGGSKVQIWDCTGAVNQKWRVNADGSINLPWTNTCLDATGGGTINGTHLDIWGCLLNSQQKYFPNDTAYSWTGIVSGDNFFCALRNDRGSGVWCAGTNTYGQLANADANGGWHGGLCQSTPATINGTTYNFFNMQLPLGEQVDVSKLNANWQYQYDSLLLMTKNGNVFGAGRNLYGKLGNGTLGDANNGFRSCLTTQYILPPGVKAVDMSTLDEFTTYVLGDDGKVYAAGRNDQGQIGDSSTTNRLTPVQVKIPRQNSYY